MHERKRDSNSIHSYSMADIATHVDTQEKVFCVRWMENNILISQKKGRKKNKDENMRVIKQTASFFDCPYMCINVKDI